MINKLVHFSDLHIRLYKDHNLYREVISDMLNQFREIKPDRIVFTGDLVHSKNQMTPELINMVAWVLTECSKIVKTILIIGNHDFLESNMERLDALTPIIDSLNNDNIVYYKNKGVFTDSNVDWVVFSLMDHNVPPEIPKSKNKKIGLFHGPVVGLTTNVGYKFEDGFTSDKFEGCDLVLCGDIHKTQVPGGSFVKVKKKCTKFPYCNQGDINALILSKNESVKEAVRSISKKYNISENVIISILEHEYSKLNKRGK